tara:strand:+ start:83 stop:418 length:336 start_codon:yes stop_codon:yes gene_type:complete
MSKLVLRIDREIGSYALFKTLKELGECLQEQSAWSSGYETEAEYYKANGRISTLSELTDIEKIKKETEEYCDLFQYGYIEFTVRQIEEALSDYAEKHKLKDNWGEEVSNGQ